ncbi:MAG: hypothetical protein U5L96_10960 [Owenweeksia sp.]|nr:hypothetical protein [Owenweeksia sp.]
MQKLVTYFSLGLLLVATLSSCVSKKKYLAAQTHIQHLQRDSAQFSRQIGELEAQLADAKNDIATCREESEERITSLMAQLAAQGEQLNEKDQVLQKRAERLKALQDRLQKQQNIVVQLRKTVEDALVNIKDEDLSVEVRNGKVYVSLSDKLLFPWAVPT